jgi:fructoselysine 6-kinase
MVSRIVAVGDNVVDCYPAQQRMFPGGNCVNVSVFARRFGAVSAYVGAIGGDLPGVAIRQALEQEGVLIERLRILDGPTAYCVIGHEQGERVFLRADLGVSMFEPAEADFAYVRGFDAVHIGQSSGLNAHIARFAQAARLSYDFSTKHDHPAFDAIAPHCFLANFSGGGLSEGQVLSLLQRALKAGARWVLVTRGRQGAILGNAETIATVAARPCTIVDTLGAGDTFIARVLVGLIADEAPAHFLDAAAAAAAETCGYYGAVGHGAPLCVAAAAGT